MILKFLEDGEIKKCKGDSSGSMLELTSSSIYESKNTNEQIKNSIKNWSLDKILVNYEVNIDIFKEQFIWPVFISILENESTSQH